MGTKSEHPREDSNIVRTGAELARLAELDRELAGQLVARARAEGVNLVGENGLLKGLVKLVLEGALEAEMSEHLGYEKGDSAGVGPPGASATALDGHRRTGRPERDAERRRTIPKGMPMIVMHSSKPANR
ncbi:hypothetical protein OG585_26120 [Streptomyces sp. NBC_01340]|nr:MULTISPECIES: hypothetical protein [unclassified Streptomyces]MCX4456068.1 hypothetical protein [Streptomyces sp. NBC_01719]MCX4495427.1 hypothetical protein [Streptomyces sp. NBC_01728]MCX4590007.1 hypothetical protein [Streptomyces sp. NBC_01549]WSI44575.1 hypothetical protein OG585_26120 [Streptomyces sp. NBC_01340]